MGDSNTISIHPDGSFLTLEISVGMVRFHAVWLRDNALDSNTLSAENGQRLITLLDQPRRSTIESAQLLPGDCLKVRFHGDDTDYRYPLPWLEAHHYDRPHPGLAGWTERPIQRWDSELQEDVPSVDYAKALNQPKQLKTWLAAIKRWGFARMTGLRKHPDALLDAVALFGYVRETNYGRYFDVRSEVNPVNLAYTSLGLQAHTDNPYRDPVPTLQILSCIENTAAGGESIVVDGFKAVETLQQENPEHFELLSSYCARFKYAGSTDVCLESKQPMIELNPNGELIAVHFNNRSAAPFTDIPFEQMPDYYAAYRHFAEIIERKQGEVSFKLQANELFIVDNTRVLHSRNSFSGTGSRWLRGCYADKDGLLSKLATLNAQQELT